MPTTITQLLGWLAEHWFGTLLFAIVTGILVWRWIVAGKDSAEGPVTYAKKKHQIFLFLIGLATIVLLGVFIAYVGPWFGKFFVWSVSTGVTNTEAVVLGTAAPTSIASPAATAQTQNFALPSPTTAQTNSVAPTYTCWSITSDATARTEANSTASLAGDGSIEAGLTVKADQTVESNQVGSTNIRARLAEAAGGVPAGSWFHTSVATQVTCP